ncbi:hypothetical protein C479_00996 [Halovivax asiaticus JCM 14624]|uniref:Uncharacterized protein n=1 Tax=Halovivax asiaticus JCM 14624 TaxID=1227490 RepID=M0BWG1_9EURY|nr:hypothetical protein C479_00996 [Halovivax asiaticus JCM 14624]
MEPIEATATVTAPPECFVTESGRYLTRWQLTRSFEIGILTARLSVDDEQVLLAERTEGRTVTIVRCPWETLPTHVELRSDGTRVWIADRRRTHPANQAAVWPPASPRVGDKV